jgi:shikimate kinase
LDELVARQSAMTIPQIFEQEGEAGFRAREHAALQSLQQAAPGIISCGGGVVVNAENHGLLRRLGTVVYLEVDAATVAGRVSQDGSRPLWGGGQHLEQLLEQRRALYEQLADVRVDTRGRTPQEVAAVLCRELPIKGIL